MRGAVALKGEPGRGMPVDGGVAPAEEAVWLRAIASGDQQAYRSVVNRFLPLVLAIARRMLRDEAEAEDVAQETFVRLWRNASALELGDGGLRPWLRRVASNLCIDRVRAGRRLVVVDDVPEQSDPARQEQGLLEADLTGRIGELLKRLPERQRLALTLFHYEGLSQREVAAMLGVSDEAVESLLARARRTLKAALKDEWRDLLPERRGDP